MKKILFIFLAGLLTTITVQQTSATGKTLSNNSKGAIAFFTWYPEGMTAHFHNASMGTFDKSDWDFGDGTLLAENAIDVVHTYTTPGVYKVKLKVTDSTTGTFHEFIGEIMVYKPSGEAQASFNWYFKDNMIYFENTSVGDITSSSWNFGDGSAEQIFVEKIISHKYINPGDYTVTVKITLTNGTILQSQRIIKVNNTPVSDLKAFFSWNINGMTVTFNNLSSGNYNTAEINFGDGNTMPVENTKPIISHTYLKSGTYEVILKIGNSTDGTIAEYKTMINIWDGTQAFANFEWFVQGQDVYLNNISTGVFDKVIWSFSDGTLDIINPTDKKIVHKFANTSGVLYVALRIENSATGQFFEIKHEIYFGSCSAVIGIEKDPTNSQKIYYRDASNGTQTAWFWNMGDGTVYKQKFGEHIYKTPGVYDVSLIVKNETTSCFEEKHMQVAVGSQACTVEIKSNPVNDKSIHLEGFSSQKITKWHWEFSDGTSSDNQIVDKSFTNDGIYIAKIFAVDETGCIANNKIEIKIGTPACFAEFAVFPDKLTKKVIIENHSYGGLEWKWDFGNGTTFSGKDPQPVEYLQDGIYKIRLQIHNSETGCLREMFREIVIGENLPNCMFKFFVDKTTNEVKFSADSPGEPTNWYWTFGDGADGTGKEISHKYEFNGIYGVSLTVTDAKGNQSNFKQEIKIGNDCDMNVEYKFYVDSTTVYFDNTSTGIIDGFHWKFGTGEGSEEAAPHYTYKNNGIYPVTLIAYTKTGCIHNFTDFIKIGKSNCNADFDFMVFPDKNEVAFKAKTPNDSFKYNWHFGDETFSDMMNPTHKYPKQGMFKVNLLVESSTGCKHNFVKQVQIGQQDCDAGFEYFYDKATKTVTFKNKPVNTETTKLWWDFGDGCFSENVNPQHPFKAEGFYKVTLGINNEKAGCMNKFHQVIQIGEKPDKCLADFFFKVDMPNKKVNFFSNSFGEDLKYKWDFGDGNFSELKDPENVYSKNAYFTVCLTVTNKQGLSHSFCHEVRVTDLPKSDCKADFDYTVNKTDLSVSLSDKSFGEPTEFIWDFGIGDKITGQKNFTHKFDKPGHYPIHLTIKNPSTLCKAHAVYLVNVGDTEGLKGDFIQENAETTTKTTGYDVQFYGVSNGGSTYSWDFGDGGSSQNISPIHNYSETGTYNVCFTVSDQNTGESDQTCYSVNVGTSEINDIQNPKNGIVISPNPANNLVSISYKITENSPVSISITDITGKEVKQISSDNSVGKGEHKIILETQDFSNGIYFIKIKAKNEKLQSKFIIVR